MSSNLKVLVADDNPDHVQLITEILNQELKAEVEGVTKGEECLEKVKKNRYDLLLLDYLFPKISGLDVLKEIVEKGYDLPVIMITGHGSEKVAVEAMKAGAIDYIVKSEDGFQSLPFVAKKAIEKDQLRKRLRQSEEKFKNLFDSANDAIIYLDKSGRILEVNKQAVDVFGGSKEEVLGKHFTRLGVFAPRDIPTFMSNFANILAGREVTQDVCIKNKKGQEIALECSASLMKTDDKVSGVMVIARDITERKRAEEALRASEQRYRLLFERNLAAVYRTTLDGTVLDCNESFVRLLGYDSREEVMACCASEFYFDVADREGFIEKLRRQGALTNFEFRMRRKDGSPVWILENVSLIEEEEGASAYLQGTSIDITERKKAEETLKKERQRLFSVLDIMPTFVYLQAPDHSVRFTNRKFRELFGDPGNRPCYEAFYGRKEPCDPCITLRVLETKAPQAWEWTSNEGRLYMIYEDLFPSEDDEDLVLEIGVDITERKRAEETLRASEQRYRGLFEDSPISLWEEDFSDIKTHIDSLRTKGVRDFRTYFQNHPEVVAHCAAQVKVVDVNKASLELFKARSKEELQRGLDKTFRQKSYGAFSEELISLADGKTMFETETLTQTLTGDKKNIALRWTVAPGYEQTYSKVLVSITDITERKRAEEALKESEEKYKALIEAAGRAGEGIIIIQDSGEGEAVFVFVNDQFCRMSDHSQEELIGRSPWDLVPPEISTRLKDWYKRRHMGESLPTHYEAAGVRKDGTVVPLELSIVTMPWQGKIATVLYLRDITERKRAEEALREGEERFRGIIENAPFGYYRVGKDELWQYVNPVWERMHGFSLEEVVGKSFEITQTEDAVGKARENVQRSLAGETITGEFSRLTRNGSIEYHSFNIQPVKHGNEIVAIEGFINDITERKRAEEALKESENRYRNLIESALDIIYTFSPDGIITSLNPAFETITGWKIKDWIGKSFTDLIHPEELSPAMKLIQESIAGKEHPRNEFRLLTKTGDYVPLDFNANPLLKDGKLIGFVGIARDITKRKRAEEELRESSEKLRLMFKSVTDGITVTDLSGIITECNEQTLKIHGYRSKDEILGKSAFALIAPEEHEKAMANMKKVLGEGAVINTEYTLLRTDGSQFNGELSASVLTDVSGNLKGLIAITRDVTEKKKMEAQLIQSERLAAVGTLAYGIAHEFNNILAGILGNAEFGMGNDDPQEMKECFQIIMESCDRAKSITSSLLAFSRQRETKKQRANVTSAVATILGLVERELEKHNIKVVRKFNPIPEIVCDLGELSGAVLNMMTNARDAMRPKGGTLTIEIEKKRDNIEMIFTDTGCGIPDSIKSKIFEPFVTTKGALGQSEIPGTGLGLFLSYGIIKRYDGEIGVKSEVGKGSTFTIRIPISKNQVSPALVKGEEEKPMDVPKNLHILLVDDEKPICTALKKFFEAKGHSVTTALSGKEGLQAFKKGSFDLVLADITMPDMDGVELISKLKKIDRQVKFIVLTGHIADEKFEKVKKTGADQIMVKPFRNEELYQAIGKIFAI